jgi:hypothetical protein
MPCPLERERRKAYHKAGIWRTLLGRETHPRKTVLLCQRNKRMAKYERFGRYSVTLKGLTTTATFIKFAIGEPTFESILGSKFGAEFERFCIRRACRRLIVMPSRPRVGSPR